MCSALAVRVCGTVALRLQLARRRFYLDCGGRATVFELLALCSHNQCAALSLALLLRRSRDRIRADWALRLQLVCGAVAFIVASVTGRPRSS